MLHRFSRVHRFVDLLVPDCKNLMYLHKESAITKLGEKKKTPLVKSVGMLHHVVNTINVAVEGP